MRSRYSFSMASFFCGKIRKVKASIRERNAAKSYDFFAKMFINIVVENY